MNTDIIVTPDRKIFYRIVNSLLRFLIISYIILLVKEFTLQKFFYNPLLIIYTPLKRSCRLPRRGLFA